MKFSEQLKTVRESLGLNQAEAAAKSAKIEP